MKYRKLGKTGLEVSEIGFGCWAIGGYSWGPQKDADSRAALAAAYEAGVNLFDTALVYGYGMSERLVGEFVRAQGERDQLFVATKINPMNWEFPASEVGVDQVFPPHHIKQALNESLRNLKLEYVDVVSLHVFAESFAEDLAWLDTLDALKDVGKLHHVGISVNSFQPHAALRILETGRIDVITVHYNVFEQAPADELFAAAAAAGTGVLVRSPLEESALTGDLAEDVRFSEGDHRAAYFAGDRLRKVVARTEAVRPVLEAAASSMTVGALRFALAPPEVSSVLVGMRNPDQVHENVSASDEGPLDNAAMRALAKHRWDRAEPKW
ncbi:MAG: aldo/keto reductase [Deltaproteobacteria bacterium]|nr:aldo/keto reductase [Deltaproteobacteria bacterium]